MYLLIHYYLVRFCDLYVLAHSLLSCAYAGTIMTGFGCDPQFSDELAKELKKRMAARGDTGQIQLSEQVLAKATQVRDKLDLIEQYFKHAAAVEAPTANEMNER
jgi:hypothetical protein